MIRRPPRSPLFPYTTLCRSKRRPATLKRSNELPLVDEIDIAPERRAHPRVAAHAQSLMRLGMNRQAYLAGRLHAVDPRHVARSEEHTSELQSQSNLVCRLLL